MTRGRTLRSLVLAATMAAIVIRATPALAVGATKGPWVQRVTSRTAVVRLEIEPAGPVTLELAPAGGDAGATQARKVESGVARTLHSIALDGLEPGTHYTYTVKGAGAVRSGAFTTAPADGSTTPFTFLAYGDNRSDDAAHAAVVKAMVAARGDFLVHTGDFVEDGGSADDWQRFFEIEAPLLRERCLYSAVGNHELTDGAGIAYARYFGPTDPPSQATSPRERLAPEHLNGTTRWGAARFFFVNSMVEYRNGVDRRWLEKALADADAEPGLTWRIVVLHHGLWSSGPHGNNKLLLQADVPALLRKHNIDLVLAGHDHIYERGANEGIPYIVTGGGGAPTYRIRAPQPFAKKLESARHFVEVSVGTEALKTRALRPDGSTLDTCDLEKGRGWLCDGAPAAAAAPLASGAPLTVPPPSKPADSASKCSCRTVGGAAESDRSLAALAVLVVAWRARRTSRKTAV